MILAKENQTDFKLEKLIESFRYRNRDFIFLVDQSDNRCERKEKVTAILQSIMQPKEDAIENHDRVSLIKFSKRLRRIFSLVQKDSNFAQLKNQVD